MNTKWMALSNSTQVIKNIPVYYYTIPRLFGIKG